MVYNGIRYELVEWAHPEFGTTFAWDSPAAEFPIGEFISRDEAITWAGNNGADLA